MTKLKIGNEVNIHGYIDEIRKDVVIIRNDGGYFGTVQSEIKSLEQPTTKDCLVVEDCVSRQAVLDLAETIQTDDNSGNEILEVIEVEDVKGLPPVTPTIPKGATNGDVVKAIFNPCRIIKYTSDVQVYFSERYYQFFGMSWWNAPYKSDCIPSEYDLSEDIELSNPQMHR